MITDLIDGFLADIANQRLVDSDRVQNILLDIRSAYTAEGATDAEFWTVIATICTSAGHAWQADDERTSWVEVQIAKEDIETMKGALS